MSLPTPWRTFTFRQVDGLDLQLDFYPGSSQPSGTFSSSARSPFLFLVHGGGYTAGNRQTWPPWIFALARSRGWAFVSADYRLVPEAGAVEIVEDVKSAWEFVVGGELNEVLGGDMKVDTSRGVVMGVSAGGWPSLHLITQTTIRPRAFISLYGVTNLVDPAFTDLPPSPLTTALLASPSPALQALISDPLPSTRKAISGSYMNLAQMHGIPFPEGWYAIAERNELDKESWDALGKSVPMTEKHLARALLFAHFGAKGLLPPAMSGPKGDQVDWKSAPLNALTVLEEDFPPTIVLHGSSDSLVLHSSSERFISRLQELGVQAKLVTQQGGDHGFETDYDPSHPQIVDVKEWVERWL